MKKIKALLGLLVIIAVISYIDSPNSPLTHPKEGTPTLAILPADREDATETSTGVTEVENLKSTLELKLKETELVDNFIVETYEEYEVFTDENGSVVKSVPTGRFEYLKYEE